METYEPARPGDGCGCRAVGGCLVERPARAPAAIPTVYSLRMRHRPDRLWHDFHDRAWIQRSGNHFGGAVRCSLAGSSGPVTLLPARGASTLGSGAVCRRSVAQIERKMTGENETALFRYLLEKNQQMF